MKYDVDYIRRQFPALSLKVNGYPAAFLDGPGGTQVPQRVTLPGGLPEQRRNGGSQGSLLPVCRVGPGNGEPHGNQFEAAFPGVVIG